MRRALYPLVLGGACLSGGCLEDLSVGISPSLALGGDGGNGVPDAAASDASRPVRDAAATAVDASRDAQADSGGSSAGEDAGSARSDAGLVRCEPSFCAIAGLVPADFSCPTGTVNECVRDADDLCQWMCL
jgi:hypothetical protein